MQGGLHQPAGQQVPAAAAQLAGAGACEHEAQLRPGLVEALELRIQQIKPEGIGEPLPQPGGLPRAPGAEQEEAPRWRLKKSPENRQKCC